MGAQIRRAPPNSIALHNVSPATRLLEKRRQMFEVQEALESQKQEFASKEEAFRKREEALKRRDLELQESLIRFSKFLQENDAKRARAEKKAADEIKARQAKEVEIAKLMEVVDGLKEEKDRVDAVVDRRMRYQRYLEGVLEVADEYQEVGELLLRHATLQATNQDLQQHMRRCNQGAEEERRELEAFSKRRNDELMLLNNRLAQLRQQLEAFEQEGAQQEAAKDSTLQLASQHILVYGQVVLATDNLFTQCKQHSRIARAASTNPLQQMEVIGNYISDLASACQAANTGPQTTGDAGKADV